MEKTKLTTITRPFLDELKQAQSMDIVDWIKTNVRMPHSNISPICDMEITPWLKDITRCFGHGLHKIIAVRSPVGSGKSTMIEALTCHIASHAPGDTLLVGQSDADMADFVQTRLLRTLRSTKETKKLLDITERFDLTNDRLMLPNMTIFAGGASKNNLQSKSVRYLLCDEAWIYRPGMLGEALKRTHDNPRAVTLIVSQGGHEGDDFSELSKQGEQFHFSWHCEDCGVYHEWDFNDIKYDTHMLKTEIDWKATLKSVRMECPSCRMIYPDTVGVRRKLANSSKYISQNANNFVAGQITYNFNAMPITRIEWKTLVREYLIAKDKLENEGEHKLYEQFMQKRLAKNWELEYGYSKEPLQLTDMEYPLPNIDAKNERGRIMSVDTQGSIKQKTYHFWVVIRAYNKSRPYKSRLCWQGRCNSIEELVKKQTEFHVDPQSVFVDGAWSMDDRITELAAQHHYYLLNGQKGLSDKRYKHGKTKGDLPYSMPRKSVARHGPCYTYLYIAQFFKDLWESRKANRHTLIPSGISEVYIQQVSAEVPEQQEDGTWKHIALSKDNHMFDAEVMNLVGAKIKKYI